MRSDIEIQCRQGCTQRLNAMVYEIHTRGALDNVRKYRLLKIHN